MLLTLERSSRIPAKYDIQSVWLIRAEGTVNEPNKHEIVCRYNVKFSTIGNHFKVSYYYDILYLDFYNIAEPKNIPFFQWEGLIYFKILFTCAILM